PPVAAAAAPPPAAPAEAQPAAVDSGALKADCAKAYSNGNGKYKAITAACGKVLQADPRAADVMVMLANAESNRGRVKESMTWAQKALAIDPALADAYVFVGTGEQ